MQQVRFSNSKLLLSFFFLLLLAILNLDASAQGETMLDCKVSQHC
ncbi:MAG: hypothetical protein AAGB31_09160 [Bdellovibrio sp.]